MRTNQDLIYKQLQGELEEDVRFFGILPTAVEDILADFKKWCKTAHTGDKYLYKGTPHCCLDASFTFINYDEAIKVDMSPVSAYSFCNYFEFTLKKSTSNNPFVNDGKKYKYKVTHNKGYFPTYYVNDVTDLSEIFLDKNEDFISSYVDVVLDDYNYFYRNGYHYDGNIDNYYGNIDNISHYEAVLAWIVSTDEGNELKDNKPDTYNVIRVIVHPKLLVDDK